MFRNPALRFFLVLLVVLLFVGQKDAKRGGQAKQGARLDNKAIMTGLADQFSRQMIEGKTLKEIQMDAAGGDCTAQCIVAAQQVAAGAWTGMVGDIGYAVIEGTVNTACKPATAAGELVKRTALEKIKKAKGANDPVLHGTTTIPLGDVVRKFGGDAATSCSVTSTVTYDRASSTVTALFVCSCSGRSCSFTISYPVNEYGQASGPATFTRL